jgi:hypothetical protein
MKTQELTSTSARMHAAQGAADDFDPFGDDGFALAIASGTSIKEAALSARISESTAYRRLKDPAFRRRVSEIRTSYLNEAVGRLSEAANEAVWTLKALLASSSDSVRLSASRAILELGTKLREQAELEERITALEREAAGEAGDEMDEEEEVDADDDPKLKSRVARLESDLSARQTAQASAGLSDVFDFEEYPRLLGQIYSTMPKLYVSCVAGELFMKRDRDAALRLAAREDGVRLRPSRCATLPRLRLSPLTLSLMIGRVRRAMRGDRRPLSLPKKVCHFYLWAAKFRPDGVPRLRECTACGYDTPTPIEITHRAIIKIMPRLPYAFVSPSDFAMESCPLCGGSLAPKGERPWSDRNRDKVVDVHVWPDGEVSVLD